jgi:hypothetical protein
VADDLRHVDVEALAMPRDIRSITTTIACAAVLVAVTIDRVATQDVGQLWVEPTDLTTRDFFHGQWGARHAPDPLDVYTFVDQKQGGINPGMTVRDSRGREWKVKQPPSTGRNAEGPIEVVLSRVLSGVGYHQPPVYFLPALRMTDGKNGYQAAGGRLRLKVPDWKSRGEWAWRDNPFVGTTPYQGLLVILLMFNSSDLKDSNNEIYEVTGVHGTERRYVVRDLGTALGSTARIAPIRGDPDVFERLGFIRHVKNGFVEFEYDGRHQPVVDTCIRPADVRWAATLLSKISDTQWEDAFRAGGYLPAIRQRFIAKLKSKVHQGLTLQESE